MPALSVLDSVEGALKTLPQGLQGHIQRTRVLARQFALQLHVDVQKADLAVAAHDLARAYDDSRQLAVAKRLGIVPNEVERGTPLLLHGPIAAQVLRWEMQCTDEDVLEACRVSAQMGHSGIGDFQVVRLPSLGRFGRLDCSASVAREWPAAPPSCV